MSTDTRPNDQTAAPAGLKFIPEGATFADLDTWAENAREIAVTQALKADSMAKSARFDGDQLAMIKYNAQASSWRRAADLIATILTK